MREKGRKTKCKRNTPCTRNDSTEAIPRKELSESRRGDITAEAADTRSRASGPNQK
jgi:hypothetical protein